MLKSHGLVNIKGVHLPIKGEVFFERTQHTGFHHPINYSSTIPSKTLTILKQRVLSSTRIL
jgi:hypothetical protein